jgi:hypothetical protein
MCAEAAGLIGNYLLTVWNGCVREIGARIIAPVLRQLPKPIMRNEFLALKISILSGNARWGLIHYL